MIFVRSLIFNILAYSIILFGCIVTCLVGFFVPKKWIWAWWNDGLLVISRKLLKFICGLEIEIRGKEHIENRVAIYASKHQSAMETYYLTSYIKKATYIFKKELTHIPFFGWAIWFYGSVPVNRKGGSAAMKEMLSHAKRLLKIGCSIIIFPEGTRTKPGAKTEYKSGVAFLYQNTDVDIIPVAINSGFFWRKNSFLRYPGKIIFEFLGPMPKGLDKKEFMVCLQKCIEDKCAELNAETLKNYPEAKKFFENSL